MVRRALQALYLLCGVLAAIFLAGIAVATLLQVVARQMGMAVETTEISGFFLAASTFLGLCYTLVNGGHVRVGLLSQYASPAAHRAVELWCCAVGALITGYAALQMTLFTLETFRFGDLSPGLLAVPLWIPQSALAFGLIVLTVAILEQATLIWRGEKAGYETNIDSTVE